MKSRPHVVIGITVTPGTSIWEATVESELEGYETYSGTSEFTDFQAVELDAAASACYMLKLPSIIYIAVHGFETCRIYNSRGRFLGEDYFQFPELGRQRKQAYYKLREACRSTHTIKDFRSSDVPDNLANLLAKHFLY